MHGNMAQISMLIYICICYGSSITLLAEFVQCLSSVSSEDKFSLHIRRSDILVGTLVGVNMRAYSPCKSLVVSILVHWSSNSNDR